MKITFKVSLSKFLIHKLFYLSLTKMVLADRNLGTFETATPICH